MEEEQRNYNFVREIMSSDKFIIFMNIMRIATLIGVVFLILYIVKEIEIVKLLNSDVCKLCMEKTDCHCYCVN
jgi:hypothetical protein